MRAPGTSSWQLEGSSEVLTRHSARSARSDPGGPELSTSPGAWRAVHIYYFENRDRLLLRAVGPLIAELIRAKTLERFFFIRFPLGGPHVRLRYLPEAGNEVAIRDEIRDHFETFLQAQPAASGPPVERLRASHRQALLEEPETTDRELLPNNSIHFRPYEAEAERYGGLRFPLSLDHFTVDSCACLFEVHAATGKPSLQVSLRRLMRQAWGAARSRDELMRLARYAEALWRPPPASVVLLANEAFARDRQAYLALARAEIESEDDRFEASVGSDESLSLWEGRAWHDLGSAFLEEPRRLSICVSHLHMSANRMGRTPSEEVYLSRLLTLALEALEESDPDWWSDVEERLATRRRSSEPPAAWARRGLDALARSF